LAELLRDFLEKEMLAGAHLIGRGILPVEGKMVIGAPPKSNKSFVALNIAMALSMERPLFGGVYASGLPVLPVRKRCRVLYIEQEIGERGLQERLRGMTAGADIGVDFYVKSKDYQMKLDDQKGFELIAREIAQVGPDVVFLDPLKAFHDRNENDAQEMGIVLGNIDKLIQQYKTAMVYVHHTAKENTEAGAFKREGGDRLRGSSVIYADADTIMMVDRKSASSVVEPFLSLSFELRHDAPLEPISVRRMKDGKVIFMQEGLQYKEKPARAQEPFFKA
jgi:RecA-family ATPase